MQSSYNTPYTNSDRLGLCIKQQSDHLVWPDLPQKNPYVGKCLFISLHNMTACVYLYKGRTAYADPTQSVCKMTAVFRAGRKAFHATACLNKVT